MLYRNMFIKIIIIAVICITINSTSIYAITEENTDNSSIAKVTDAQYASIEKILEYINKEIKNIDEKISLSRTLTEYEKYPAVRLNIDTPYFGIYSIINSKLKIRDDVSTVDMASGYGIKSIVNRRSIKIESFEVSSIVVITRDVKIDKNMTSTDAQTCIFKLLDYLQQTKSVNKFLDKQLSSMIKGYFTDKKDTTLTSINEQIEQIEENLNLSLTELSYIKATTENDITEDTITLYKYKDEISTTKSKIKSVLIDQTKLDEIYKNIQNTNEDIKLYRFNVNKKYLEVINTIDLEKAAYLINLKMTNEMTYLQDYIDNSKVEIVEPPVENTNVLEKTTVQSIEIYTEIKEKQYKQVYKVASETIIQNMQKDVDNVSKILDGIAQNSLIADNQSENKEKLNPEKTVNQLLQIYIQFLNKENVFLTENAKINITEIKKSNDLNITSFENVEYIFINLSDVLTRISDSFISYSVISNINIADNLKQVINKVILCGTEFKKPEKINSIVN